MTIDQIYAKKNKRNEYIIRLWNQISRPSIRYIERQTKCDSRIISAVIKNYNKHRKSLAEINDRIEYLENHEVMKELGKLYKLKMNYDEFL